MSASGSGDVQPHQVAGPSRSPDPSLRTRAGNAVLTNDELLTLIFREIMPQDPSTSSRSELVNARKQMRDLAICSRAMTEPALNCLWTCLDSLHPLLRLLPGFDIENNESYFLPSLPDTSALVRHARRIRVLDLLRAIPNATAKVSPHLYVLLAKEFENRQLFSNLHQVLFRPWSLSEPHELTEAFGFLPLVFCPPVKALHFQQSSTHETTFAEYCLPLAVKQLHNLAHLSFSASNEEVDLGQAIFETISLLTSLECLEVRLRGYTRMPPQSLVGPFRALTKLRSVTLDVHFHGHSRTEPQFDADPSILDLRFENLTKIKLFYRDSCLCRCFPLFLVDRMTTLNLSTSSNTLQHIADSIPNPNAVETLEIVGHTRLLSFVPLLRRLPRLQEFKITYGYVWYPRGDVTRMLQEAFPVLENGSQRSLVALTFPRSHRSDWRTGMVLDDLISLSQGAVGLEHLTVALWPEWLGGSISQCLDAARRRRQTLDPAQRDPPNKLRTLRLVDGRDVSFTEEQRDNLAELLDLLFPSLEAIRPYADFEEGDRYWKESWSKIERLRRMYQAIRVYRGW